MSKKQDRMVYRREDGKWVNKRNSADKASSVHNTRKGAEDAAREMLRNQGKGVDGRLRNQSSIKQENFDLAVNNLGPIVEANIELKPLSIFVGHSNSGKSYLAKLLYVIQKSLSIQMGILGMGTLRPVQYAGITQSDYLCKKLQKLIAKLPHKKSLVIKKVCDAIIQEDKQAKLFQNILLYYFGFGDIKSLTRKSSRKMACIEIRFKTNTNEYERSVFNYKLNPNKVDLKIAIPETFQKSKRLLDDKQMQYLLNIVHEIKSKEVRYRALKDITEELYLKMIAPLNRNIFYLPASRSGVMLTKDAVVSSLVSKATTTEQSMPLLSALIGDFMQHLHIISQLHQRGRVNEKMSIRHHATLIEKEILKGSIIVDKSNINPNFLYNPHEWNNEMLLMEHASSMVTELAPLVLYLRYLVKPGDTIILEEPEAHLHPEAMEILAGQIAKLISDGVRIIITTHSELMLEKLANMVLDKNVGLQSSDVGAWQFKPHKRSKGTIVSEVKLDYDSGMYQAGLDETSDKLYNDWVRSTS